MLRMKEQKKGLTSVGVRDGGVLERRGLEGEAKRACRLVIRLVVGTRPQLVLLRGPGSEQGRWP